MSWLRGTALAAIGAAAADYLWQRTRADPNLPKSTDMSEVAAAGVGGGVLAALWSWSHGRRRR